MKQEFGIKTATLVGKSFFYGHNLHIVKQVLITEKGEIWIKSEQNKYHHIDNVDIVVLTVE